MAAGPQTLLALRGGFPLTTGGGELCSNFLRADEVIEVIMAATNAVDQRNPGGR